jgi:hypothetical protein
MLNVRILETVGTLKTPLKETKSCPCYERGIKKFNLGVTSSVIVKIQLVLQAAITSRFKEKLVTFTEYKPYGAF